MGYLTKDDILAEAQKLNVKFIRLQFINILGIVKNVAVTIEQLADTLEGRIMFDGSSVDGFTRLQESDMYLKPDYNTFTVFPWRPETEGKVARLICDVYTPEGEPFAGDPRNALKEVIKEVAEMGYTIDVGPELEFFLFNKSNQERTSLKTNDSGSYFDLAPIDLGQDAR
ncbi:hypothetical protein JCM16358_06070 [Halanaerocella petrolearia]